LSYITDLINKLLYSYGYAIDRLKKKKLERIAIAFYSIRGPPHIVSSNCILCPALVRSLSEETGL
jgi:hypothetical protein